MHPRLHRTLRSPLLSYPIAVFAVALVAGVRVLLDPWLGEHHPFIPFLAAVFAAAWAGGWKPALLALALGYAAADLLFLRPRYSLGLGTPEDLIGLAFYLAVGGGGTTLVERIRRHSEVVRANDRLLAEAAERRRTEAAARRLANIVDSTAVAVVGKGLDGVVTDWNGGAERLFGYTAAEAVGRHAEFLLPPDQRPRWEQVEAGVRRGEHSPAFEAVWRRRDGSTVPVSVATSPILDGDRLVGVSTISRDLTEVKRLEGELRQAQKMEAFGQLAGGVAHDFNNLLTVINGYSELLLDAPGVADRFRKPVEAIRDAGERAAGLTRQLLAFSRKTAVQPRVHDLNALVDGVRRLLERLIGEDVRLATDLGRLSGRVRVDAGQFEQVLLNLCVNARDAMPTGGRLSVSTAEVEVASDPARPELAAGRYARVSVADTGEGMTDEVKARIFEPFFTTKGVGKGTGLGLATAYGIVRQSGGWIGVSSEAGVGTTFAVDLPLVGGDVAADTPGPRQAAEGGSETVLVVEDDSRVRGMIAEALRAGGYTVLEASGAEQLFGAHPPAADLVLTDVVMPGPNGREVAGRLAAKWPGLRVVYMSGYTDDAVLRNGVRSGEVAFLQKPFGPDALLRKVRQVLDNPADGWQRVTDRRLFTHQD